MKIKRIPAGIYGANCYILYDENTRVGCVIDPGGDADVLIKEINNSKIEPKFILLTHGHIDHVGGVEELKKNYNIPVYINRKDKELMNGRGGVFGFLWNVTEEDKDIKDGDVLRLGDLEIICIETPGHTPGGMCFLVNNVIFTGDTLFHGSIGRTDFIGGDYRELINSIKTKLMSLSDDIIVLPGHEGKSSIGFEREHNPFL